MFNSTALAESFCARLQALGRLIKSTRSAIFAEQTLTSTQKRERRNSASFTRYDVRKGPTGAGAQTGGT